jgi:hypothetical protein
MLRLVTMFLSFCILFGLPGCNAKQSATLRPKPAPPKPEVKLAPPTPLAQKKQELGGKTWNPEWDVLIERSLPPALLSRRAAHAVRGYCPYFAEESPVNKRAFWAYFFQALAASEAGLNPTADVHHTEAEVDVIDPVTRRPTRQEGLLQLTYQDGRRYGCDFNWKRDRGLPGKDPARTILQPRNNLLCGLRILENQIIDQKRPLVVRNSYWSTLHPGTVSYQVFAKQMENVPAACGAGMLKPRRRAPIHREEARSTP